MKKILYHGTSSANIEEILDKGLLPEKAGHKTKLLRKIQNNLENIYAHPRILDSINTRITQRLGARNIWSSQISLVDDYGIARAWAKDHQFGSEQIESLHSCYDFILDQVPEVEENKELITKLVDNINELRENANGESPAVIKVEIDLKRLGQKGMYFYVPKDGRRFNSINEYRGMHQRESMNGKQDEWNECLEYVSRNPISSNHVIGGNLVGKAREFELLEMPRLRNHRK